MNFPERDAAEHDAIAAHDRIAKYYRFRTPYGASFFQKFARGVGIGPETEVLDLCCGTGAVAAGLAPHCRKVDAIDGAPAMIELAPRIECVDYHLVDINSPAFADWASGRTFDLITIGMGIHWLDDAVLDGLRNHLRPGGKLAILATGFVADRRNPWFGEYMAIRQSLRHIEVLDWTGEPRLLATGYGKLETIEQIYRARASARSLVDHMLSFSATGEVVAKAYPSVLARMEERLAPYVRDGALDCIWVSTARIYEDQSGLRKI